MKSIGFALIVLIGGIQQSAANPCECQALGQYVSGSATIRD